MSSFNKGLLLGVALGIAIALVVTVTARSAPNPGSSAQVEELTRKLASAQEARARAAQQMEHFQKVAEQMTASFEKLERRFNELSANAPTPAAPPPPIRVD